MIEKNKVLIDGFRRGRSTVDHLLSFTNIIESRKTRNLETFTAFIDFSRAYDRICRKYLWYKLEKIGISGNILGALKSLYTDVSCCVKIGLNSHLTEWFSVNSGLRQGCLVSPTLFNLYINDLGIQIKQECAGISLDNGEKICLLAYADDIVLLAEREDDLQHMLTLLERWCKDWDISINTKKSQIVHFRKESKIQTEFVFTIDGITMDIVNQ